ncbi:MAG: hypothetical protein M1831_004211 [Alyxoria varia]|nr:MAG: hypothetical protein M1831_004211 [Alyxoria varia]
MAGHGVPPPPPAAPMPPAFNNRPNPQHQQFLGNMGQDLEPPVGQFQGMALDGPGALPNRGPAQKKPETVSPSYQGFILRKDPHPPNGKEPHWSCIYKNPMDVDSDELATLVKQTQAKTTVTEQYNGLLSDNQRLQIDRLVREQKDADKHPDAMWTKASIQDVRSSNKKGRGSTETKQLEVILKRQSKCLQDVEGVSKKGGIGKGKVEKEALEPVHTGVRVDLNEKPKTDKAGKGAFAKGPQLGHGNHGNFGQQFDRPPEGTGHMGWGPVGGNQSQQRPPMGPQPSFHQPNFPQGPPPPHNAAPPQQRPNVQPRPPPPVQVVPDPFDDGFDEPIQVVRGSSPSPGPQLMGGRPPQNNRTQPVHQHPQGEAQRHDMHPSAPQRPQPQQHPFQHRQQPGPNLPPRPQFRKEPDFGESRAPGGPQRRNSMFEKGRTNLGKKPKPPPVVVDQHFSSDEDSFGESSQFSHGSAEFSSPISSPITGSTPSERAERAHRGVDFMTGRRDPRYRKHRPREPSEESFDIIDDVVNIPHRSNGRRYSGRRERDLAMYKPRERLTRSERLDKEIYLDALEKKKREEELRHLERLRDEQRYETHRRDRARKDSRRDSLEFGGLRSPTSPRKPGRQDLRHDDYFDRVRF